MVEHHCSLLGLFRDLSSGAISPLGWADVEDWDFFARARTLPGCVEGEEQLRESHGRREEKDGEEDGEEDLSSMRWTRRLCVLRKVLCDPDIFSWVGKQGCLTSPVLRYYYLAASKITLRYVLDESTSRSHI